jgi:protocatechuate 3,4-dioxygenase beta subunit
MMMKRLAGFAGWVSAVVLLAAGCAALPAVSSEPTMASTTTVLTGAPGATEAPGSTEASDATPEPGVAIATVAAEPALSAQDLPATTAPEPTMPAAPTAPEQTTAVPSTSETVASPISCTPGALTPSQTEGPYYKANPPEASDLLQPGMGGTKLTITGYVLDAACRPVPDARVDFWQADSEGQYDNQGYTLRGYQVTDAQGRYSVETVVPGLYPGRTRHIHVKVSAPNGQVLTTQLYFPGEAANNSDQIFNPDLVIKVDTTGTRETGSFNFVIDTP